MNMDKNWISLPRALDEFKNSLSTFLDDIFSTEAIGNQVCCPCKKCVRRFCHYREDVYDHLIVNGFFKGFKQWNLQRDQALSIGTTHESGEQNDYDNIDGLLHDTFRDVANGFNENEGPTNELNEEARKFYKLIEDGQQELYSGCANFSKLSFIIRLYLFKCLNGLSNVAFNDLLDLLKEAFPFAKLPKNFQEAKNIIRDLGLDFKKIHACRNDCMLYWKEHEKDDCCSKCKVSRWKSDNVPAKVLRHFPLKPRLQRLFMCAKTADSMFWHDKERPTDGNIRHPADGED